jgi:hypothetical protein
VKSGEAATSDELLALETGKLDPSAFPHPEHVRFAYAMLERYAFGEAITRFSRGLKLLAAKAGRPEIYHETITVAFLALIGERRARAQDENWSEFQANNCDLFDKRCLGKWYGAEQLGSDLARRTFCLPTPLPRRQDPGSFSLSWQETRRREGGPRSKLAPA